MYDGKKVLDDAEKERMMNKMITDMEKVRKDIELLQREVKELKEKIKGLEGSKIGGILNL